MMRKEDEYIVDKSIMSECSGGERQLPGGYYTHGAKTTLSRYEDTSIPKLQLTD